MKIYCCGIGGIGLSAYAALQKMNGHEVLGSDRSDSALLDDLRSQGIKVFLNQDGSHVPADTDLFVYSEVIPEGAPERVQAKESGIRQMSYFAALGDISKDYFVIAVCGTHGKSSTTAMAARVLLEMGKDPTVIVGTKVPELGDRNWRRGASDIFLVEACEYRHDFLFLKPDLILMTNVDGDHFDAYESVEAYRRAFVDFLALLPAGGSTVLHGEDPDSIAVARATEAKIVDADVLSLPTVRTPGMHMRQNARLVLGMAQVLGMDLDEAMRAVSGYGGSWRRMELKGNMGKDMLVMDDYGHHPAEIKAVLSAVREAYPKRRIVCVFQPHTHHRTRVLYEDFIMCFSAADLVVISDVYVARSEIETGTVDVDQFVADISKRSGVPARNGQSLVETERLLREEIAREGDLILCMGAGTITDLATKLVQPIAA